MAFKKKTPGKNAARGLGKREQSFLHLKEFSQGKPNELSLNVLEQKAAAANEREHPHRFRSLFNRGTSKPIAPTPDSTSVSASDEGKRPKASTASAKSAASSGKSGSQSGNQSGDKPSAQSGAASARPARKGHSEKRAKRPPSVASSHAAPRKKAGESTLFTADSRSEIEKRQRRRRVARRLSVAFVVVICICLIGVGGYYGYQQYQRLSTAVGVLNEACDIISQTDETIVALDEYFQTSFNDDTVTAAQGFQSELPSVREELEQARLYAHKASSELEGSQRDKEAADRVLNAIASRETMLDCADQRLAEDISAKQALDVMESAEACIQEGNALLAQSAQVISDTTNENVAASTEYTLAAQGKFSEAHAYVEQVQGMYPAADFTALLAYIEKRSEATSEALLSNEAILIQDKATAESHNDAYNAADAEAVEMAEALPENHAQPIIDAYATATAQATEEYEAARQDAASNDSYLRDYLGTSSG